MLDPWFSVSRLELLSRGVAFAVAHVRGGGDRGEPWYLAGKLEHKENSFRDFLAARDALVEHGVSDAARIAAYGASAGGLLVGASLNLAPEAFCAAVLDVPFVDVLRTMENPDLPLTTAEYTEWGNPDEPDARKRIRAYSPLDNLEAQPWPTVLLQEAGTIRACPTGNRPSSTPDSRKWAPHAVRCCFAPTWPPGMAARRAASRRGMTTPGRTLSFSGR